MKLEEHIGEKFGMLTLISREGLSKSGKRKWLCQCECGEFVERTKDTLVSFGVRSCGCASYTSRTKHGMTNSPTYKSWEMMVQRCTNENFDGYFRYGGRGIQISSDWRSFEAFYLDMGERPDGMTLERLDVDGNYCKENCKWVGTTDQAFNKRTLDSNSSGRTGVYWHKHSEKWTAQITHQGVKYHLGLFLSYEDAVKARENAELKYYRRLKK